MVGLIRPALSAYTNPGAQAGLLPFQQTSQPLFVQQGQTRTLPGQNQLPPDGLKLMAGLLATAILAAVARARGLGTTAGNTATVANPRPPIAVAPAVTLPTGQAAASPAQLQTLGNDPTISTGLNRLNGDTMGRALLQSALASGTKIMSQQQALADGSGVPENAKAAFRNPNSGILALHVDTTPSIIIMGNEVLNNPAKLDEALREELFHDISNPSINTVAQSKAPALQSLGVNLSNLNQAPVNSFVEEGALTKHLAALARGETITAQQWLSTLNLYAAPYLNNNQTNDDAVNDAAIDSSIAGALALGVNPAQLVNLRGAVTQFRQSPAYLNSNAARRGNN